MNSQQLINVGIIGTGWVAGLHLESLRQIANTRVVAIAGRNEARARQLAAPFGARVYPDALPMLQKERLDAVFILLPPHLHGDLERACAENVRGVLIEKPITQSLESAQIARDAFQKAGTIVSVGYMNRYRQSVQRARDLFARPGEPGIIANGWWITQMPPPLWWRTFPQSGGQFVEQCTHLVDICRYTMGDIVEVSAYATRGFMPEVADFSVDDAMVVNARFASGALASFATGCFPQGSHANSPGVGLSLSSRKHRIDLSGWELSGTLWSAPDRKETLPSEENIFVIQNRIFIEAVANQDSSRIRSTYTDGMKTLAVTLAANRSARDCNGAPVAVPL